MSFISRCTPPSIITLLLCAAAVPLAYCDDVALFDTPWRLVKSNSPALLDDDSTTVTLRLNRDLTLFFSEGCRQYLGKIKIRSERRKKHLAGRLVIASLAALRTPCLQEARLGESLSGRYRYRLVGKKLRLNSRARRTERRVRMIFKAAELTLCGDGNCEGGESAAACDPVPGHPEICDGHIFCPEDCRPESVCGNDLCEVSEADTCPQDCDPEPVARCGDGRCEDGESAFGCDPVPELPEICDGHVFCPEDCQPESICGNSLCEIGEAESCPQDCPAEPLPECGDGRCEGGESAFGCDPVPELPNICADHIFCPEDCRPESVCGDGLCEINEAESCPLDCPSEPRPRCGDGRCEGGESPFGCDPVPELPNICADHIFCPEDCGQDREPLKPLF